MRGLIKKTLLVIARYSGFFELCRRNSVKKGHVPILIYHRVLENPKTNGVESTPSTFSIMGLGVRQDLFDRQMAYLKQRYHVVSLQDYVQKKKKGERLKGCAVVTFDDGFKDVSPVILKKHGIPATVFLIGEAPQKVFWRHEIFFLLDETSVLKTLGYTLGAAMIVMTLLSALLISQASYYWQGKPCGMSGKMMKCMPMMKHHR